MSISPEGHVPQPEKKKNKIPVWLIIVIIAVVVLLILSCCVLIAAFFIPRRFSFDINEYLSIIPIYLSMFV